MSSTTLRSRKFSSTGRPRCEGSRYDALSPQWGSTHAMAFFFDARRVARPARRFCPRVLRQHALHPIAVLKAVLSSLILRDSSSNSDGFLGIIIHTRVERGHNMMRFNHTSALVYEELSGEIRRACKSSSEFESERFGTEVWDRSVLRRCGSGPSLVPSSEPHSCQDRLSTLSNQYRGEYFVGGARWPAWEGVTT